jgi:predicted transcriptional regulator
MRDYYAEIINCLSTPKRAVEISNECNINIGSLNDMMDRLLNAGLVSREKKKVINVRQPMYVWTRLVESTTRAEVMKKPEPKITNPFARIITERHPISEKKKSPRVYVGCSFNQVGW